MLSLTKGYLTLFLGTLHVKCLHLTGSSRVSCEIHEFWEKNHKPHLLWLRNVKFEIAVIQDFNTRSLNPSITRYKHICTIYSGFFWTFRKKTQGQKNSSPKKLQQIFEKLKQIIQNLNNLSTKN